jgi:23S rRNA (uridine2552-2'-O)-methyltransferase
MLKTRIKKAAGRTESSRRWLERQINDPFVRRAREMGLRSRAAFKIREIDEKFRILKPGARVVDIGAAPGGWSEYAASKKCKTVAVDILDMPEIPGVIFGRFDFAEPECADFIRENLGSAADVVMSDIAPNTTGNASVDHLRIMALAEWAFDFAVSILAPGGAFVSKVRQGGTEGALLARMKRLFASVRHFKPDSSRKESAETYVVASGFRG